LPGTHSSGTKGALPIVCDGEGLITSVLHLPADLIVLASAEVRQLAAALIIKVRPVIRVTAATGRVAMVVPGSTKTVVVVGTTKTVAGTGVITAITFRRVSRLDDIAVAPLGTGSGGGIRSHPLVNLHPGLERHRLAEEVTSIVCGSTVTTVGRHLDGRL
jgi:hypothetical protein